MTFSAFTFLPQVPFFSIFTDWSPRFSLLCFSFLTLPYFIPLRMNGYLVARSSKTLGPSPIPPPTPFFSRSLSFLKKKRGSDDALRCERHALFFSRVMLTLCLLAIAKQTSNNG